MSGRYWRQGHPVLNGLFHDTGKSPASVYCAHLSDKSGNLSSLGGVFATPSLYLIKLSAYNTSFKTNNLYLLCISSFSLFLCTASFIPLHSAILLLYVCFFLWASCIASRIFRISHQRHPCPLSEILVRCLWPGQVGKV